MFKKQASNETKGLDQAIETVLMVIDNADPTTEDYAKLVDQLEQLYKIRDTQRPTRISRDALAAVLGNLAGIVLIIHSERVGIITSKAVGFVLKARV